MEEKMKNEKRVLIKEKTMELHKFLEQMSPDASIKLYYIDEGRCVYDGYAGEITESIMFTNFMVDSHAYNGSEMLIWIY